MKEEDIITFVIPERDIRDALTKGKYYRVLSRFNTDLVSSGHCIVLQSDKLNIEGFDSQIFIKS